MSKAREKLEREADEDLLASGFEFLDKNNLDVKLDYLLQKNMKKNMYDITGYVFIPTELKINKDSYSKQMFFHDFQSFIRFQTPTFPLAALVRPENELSPLNRIKEILNELLSGKFDSDELNKKLVYELKMQAQIVRSNLRRQVVYLMDLSKQGDSEDLVRENVKELIQSMRKILDDYHGIQANFFDIQVPEKIKATYLAADEYTSYYTEHYFTVLLNSLNTIGAYSDLVPDIEQMIEQRQARRKAMKYTLVLEHLEEDPSRLAKIHYWKGFLKTYMKQVLTLDIQEKADKPLYGQLFATIGAMVAMAFYTIITVFAFSNLAAHAIPYLIVIVVFYAMRERIKSVFDWIGRKFLKGWIADKRNDLFDPKNNEKIGVIRQRMDFIFKDAIPADVMEIRNSDRKNLLEREASNEQVILFHKSIVLYTDRITHIHERHKNLNDIITINLHAIIENAFEPKESILWFDAVENKLQNIEVPIFYHINLVLKMEFNVPSGEKKTSYKRIRIVFDRTGVKSVDDISV